MTNKSAGNKRIAPIVNSSAIIVLTFILLIPLVSLANSNQVTIVSKTLNVRNGPGLSYEVIKQVNKAESYDVISTEGDWIKIRLSSSETGWVAGWLVDKKNIEGKNSFYTPTVNSLRVRSGPGTNFQIIGQVSKGDQLAKTDQNENWLKIKNNDVNGWVSTDYIMPAPKNEAVQSKKEKVLIQASSLNVRSAPSLSASIIGKLKAGDQVGYVAEENNWFQINYKNTSDAWISSDFAAIMEEENKREQQPKDTMAVVHASILNVREQPSLSSRVLERLVRGDVVSTISEKGEWTEIKLANNQGWVASEFLKKEAKSMVTILSNGTNIRKGPSTDTEVVKRGNEGDAFQVIGKNGDWYEILLEDNTKAFVAGWIVSSTGPVAKVKKAFAGKQLAGKVIVIDPGHGGKDHGATGASGTIEKELTSKTSELLADKLEASGAEVILTRSNDHYLTLKYRVGLSHYYDADAFLSLHYDSSVIPGVNGTTTFYYDKEKDEKLAKAIHKQLVNNTGLVDRKVNKGNFFVLRENRQPSALIELGFLSNKREELLVNTKDYQEKATDALYKGLIDYFE